MINKLISLVLLIFFLMTSYSYSEDEFLFPKKKPSVFKKIEKNLGSEDLRNLPQKKPIIKTEIILDETIKTKKNEEKGNEKIKKPILKKEVKTIQKIDLFLLPQKKTNYIQNSI